MQGSSRGLGVEFVRQLLQRPETSVVATCRTPAKAEELQELQRQSGGRLLVLPLDPGDESSIAAAAERVREGRGSRWRSSARCMLQEPCSARCMRCAWQRMLGSQRAPSCVPLRPHRAALACLPAPATRACVPATPSPQVAARHQHLDVLINASGILHDAATGLAPETALSRVTLEGLTACFHVNAAGHILVAKHFQGLLAAAAAGSGATE